MLEKLKTIEPDISRQMIKTLKTPEELKEYVVERQKKLARTFHERMTQGQSFEEVNDYRKAFYKTVVNAAETVSLCSLDESL